MTCGRTVDAARLRIDAAVATAICHQPARLASVKIVSCCRHPREALR
jgi:hypothetical protein